MSMRFGEMIGDFLQNLKKDPKSQEKFAKDKKE